MTTDSGSGGDSQDQPRSDMSKSGECQHDVNPLRDRATCNECAYMPASVFLTLTHGSEGGDVCVFATPELRDRYASALPDDVAQRTELIDAWPLDEAATAAEIADWSDLS